MTLALDREAAEALEPIGAAMGETVAAQDWRRGLTACPSPRRECLTMAAPPAAEKGQQGKVAGDACVIGPSNLRQGPESERLRPAAGSVAY